MLWERMVFLSRPFWRFATPLVHARFPHAGGVDAEAFYRGLNRVEPGLIRVEADEVTYALHVILRRERKRERQGFFVAFAFPPPHPPRFWKRAAVVEIC